MLPSLPDTQTFVWQDRLILKSSMGGITLSHYISIERCEALIVAVCQGPLPGDVWEIMLHREPLPTHLLHHSLLQKLTWWVFNAFPRLIRLPWVVRFPGQIMKAQLTLKIRGYSFIFILCFSYTKLLLVHMIPTDTQFKHISCYFTRQRL